MKFRLSLTANRCGAVLCRISLLSGEEKPIDYANIPAHQVMERVFRTLLPEKGLTEREGQITLCQQMMDTLIASKTALFDVGVGIGKTYAYLTACILLQRFYSQTSVPSVVISTSSVALQEALFAEYIPFLSQLFLENQVVSQPVTAIIRKGKERFVCDLKLHQRLEATSDKLVQRTLFSLKHCADLDKVSSLSDLERKRVSVPEHCPPQCVLKGICRYHQHLKSARNREIFIQICNHNYLLTDALHRQQGLKPLLRDYRALVIDEAYKLPEVARQMYSRSFSAEDAADLCRRLKKAGCPNMTKRFWEKFASLFDIFKQARQAHVKDVSFTLTCKSEMALREVPVLLEEISDQLGVQISQTVRHQLEKTMQIVQLFLEDDQRYVLYVQHSPRGPTLCVASKNVPEQLGKTLKEQNVPVILTSGTLRARNSFERIRQKLELALTSVGEFIAESPFNYEEDCLLYIPQTEQKMAADTETETAYLAEQILNLTTATHGHTLALFTSYALMGRVHKRLKDSLLTVWRHSERVIGQFKQMPNAVLFAAGSCWEGMDFPGDMVSSLIIPRLPFPVPKPLS
jgi:ATP-dependent DNA helicase DinG